MKPPSNDVDQHGFPIPPTFEGDRARNDGARRVGRLAWRWGLVLVFVALLVSSALKSGMVDYGKAAMANGLVDRAHRKLSIDDVDGALADLNRAAGWNPQDEQIYELRASVRLQANDVHGSLEDYNKLIAMAPHFADGYLGRSMALQRLNRHEEAIEDLDKAIAASPDGDPSPLNARAYARAIAGVELEQGMRDIEIALKNLDDQFGEGLQKSNMKAHFLDTRGYLHYLLDNQPEALKDLDQAIELEENFKRLLLNLPMARSADSRTISRYRRSCDHALAVMYHHRGQVHAKLGDEKRAAADMEHGDKLGYDPAKGVY